MYGGLGLTAAATLMLQIALTRLFSVTMWYHMSLVSVSMAMFGMTVGALLVHALPRLFPAELLPLRCQQAGLAFALAILASVSLCLSWPFSPSVSLAGATQIVTLVALVGLPFVFSGVTVCLCLTSRPERAGRLYAADLAGAALGCLLTVGLLNTVDAPTAVVGIAAVAALGACLFRPGPAGIGVALALAGLTLANLHGQWVRVRYVQGLPYPQGPLKYQFWNAFSYIIVCPPDGDPHLWGPGRNLPAQIGTETMRLFMDVRAGTMLVHCDGDFSKLQWLRYDVTALAHSLRPQGRVLVIGSGGGRDVTTALLSGERQVDAVEINPITTRIVNQLEGDFTGFPHMPTVHQHLGDARSWVARSSEHYAVITVPLVDTSAASAAGAYALTENSLYTAEAFQSFLDHLEPGGVLSVSRWWSGGKPGEFYRLLVLASEALRRRGVQHPRQHLLAALGTDVVTLLVSNQPYGPADLAAYAEACQKYGFTDLLSPQGGLPPLVPMVEDPAFGREQDLDGLALDFSAPTDDRPYYFHYYSLKNLFKRLSSDRVGAALGDQEAMTILLALVIAVSVLWAGTTLVPGRRDLPAGGFFTLIGLGFMFYESAQMQRLSLFLGYPLYALTIVLFTVLLTSAAGSWWIGRRGPAGWVPLALLAVYAGIGLVSSPLLHALAGAPDAVRPWVAMAVLAPPGFLLGTMFPMGLMLSRHRQVSLPWCWALNGAASTAAAVYSIALSISWGIAVTYWLGLACYGGAALLLSRLGKDGQHSADFALEGVDGGAQ